MKYSLSQLYFIKMLKYFVNIKVWTLYFWACYPVVAIVFLIIVIWLAPGYVAIYLRRIWLYGFAKNIKRNARNKDQLDVCRAYYLKLVKLGITIWGSYNLYNQIFKHKRQLIMEFFRAIVLKTCRYFGSRITCQPIPVWV